VRRYVATLAIISALAFSASPVLARPAATYGIDACVVGGSTTVSWDNFNSRQIEFFWYGGTDSQTYLGRTVVSGGGIKSPVTVPTVTNANYLRVEWSTGQKGGLNTAYSVSGFCS